MIKKVHNMSIVAPWTIVIELIRKLHIQLIKV